MGVARNNKGDTMTTNRTASTFLTDRQVAERYGVSRPTIWRWRNEGRFPLPVKLGPAVTRWRLADLERWEQTQGEVAP